MATISTSDYHTSVRKIDTVDALWAIISSQPKKIRRALAERLQGELVNAKSKKTGLDKALDDVEICFKDNQKIYKDTLFTT